MQPPHRNGYTIQLFGAKNIPVPLPLLGGVEVETTLLQNPSYQQVGPFDYWEDDAFAFGHAELTIGAQTEAKNYEDIYTELFVAAQDISLYRIWNYLPKINSGESDQERYKQFCEGRSNAFKLAHGDSGFSHMPAATCAGAEGD